MTPTEKVTLTSEREWEDGYGVKTVERKTVVFAFGPYDTLAARRDSIGAALLAMGQPTPPDKSGP